MSDLFKYIYEEKDELNLLSGGKYGDCIGNCYIYKSIDKCAYYDTVNYNNVSYKYTNGDDDDNISNVYVTDMLYNDMCYNCKKHDGVDEIYFIYKKMRGNREYYFTIYPFKPVFMLGVGKEWDVLMEYFAGVDRIEIWFNLHNGESHVNSQLAYRSLMDIAKLVI